MVARPDIRCGSLGGLHRQPHHVRNTRNTAGFKNTSVALPRPRFWPSAPGVRHLAPDGHQRPRPHKCLAGSPPRHWCVSPWASCHGYASSDAVISAPRAVSHAASDGANHFNQKDDGEVGRALSPTAVAAGSSPSPPTPLWPPASRQGPAGSHDCQRLQDFRASRRHLRFQLVHQGQ